MLEAEVILKLNKVLSAGNDYVPERFDKLLYNAARIILRNYKKEIPVDKGIARSDVNVYKLSSFNYMVTTKVTSRGIRYPLMVHEGTYDFKGIQTDYGKINRRRMKGKFNFIDHRSGKKGIRPNKFANRARSSSEPEVNTYMITKLDELMKEK